MHFIIVHDPQARCLIIKLITEYTFVIATNPLDVRGQNLNFAVSGEMIEKLRDAVYDKLLSNLKADGTVYSVPMDNGNLLEKPRTKKRRGMKRN